MVSPAFPQNAQKQNCGHSPYGFFSLGSFRHFSLEAVKPPQVISGT